MPAKKKKPVGKTTRKANADPAYKVEIEHTIPTVQYGNVRYKITSPDIAFAVKKLKESIKKYPPHDPLQEQRQKDMEKANKEAVKTAIKKQSNEEPAF